MPYCLKEFTRKPNFTLASKVYFAVLEINQKQIGGCNLKQILNFLSQHEPELEIETSLIHSTLKNLVKNKVVRTVDAQKTRYQVYKQCQCGCQVKLSEMPRFSKIEIKKLRRSVRLKKLRRLSKLSFA